MNSNIWLIGLGQMSYEYAKVLCHLNLDFISVGRSKVNKKFNKYHKLIYDRGLRSLIKSNLKPPKHAIVAVNIEELYDVTKFLILHGCKNILLEKPGSLSINHLKKLMHLSNSRGTKIHIAYNRRYYNSVIKAKKLYLKGKITSVHFDFTEIQSRFINKFPNKIIKNWLICNSSHVIDLVFYIIGKPKKINFKNYSPRYLMNKNSVFIGSGISKKNIPFSYHSNWSSPGNWSISFMTKKQKVVFNPLESLKIQNISEFQLKKDNLDDKDDELFKPGLLKMVSDFIYHKKKLKIPSITEQIENFKIFNKIG